jgi:pimeloyl-ACP methyl ester carboxylesterase
MPSYPALSPLQMSVLASDGLVLRGQLVYPHGKAGSKYPIAVLAHQYPATRDTFAPLAADLHALGVATLAFDLRGHGESIWTTAGVRLVDTPVTPTMEAFATAFMSSAVKTGFAHISDDIVRVASWGMTQNYIDASRVVLVGASVGGTGVLLAAPQLDGALCGVVTFAAAGAPTHGTDAPQRIRRNCEGLRAPILMTSSQGDPFDAAKNAESWTKGLSHARTLIVPGADHAMAIYYAVRREVLSFVRNALGSTTPPREGKRPSRVSTRASGKRR